MILKISASRDPMFRPAGFTPPSEFDAASELRLHRRFRCDEEGPPSPAERWPFESVDNVNASKNQEQVAARPRRKRLSFGPIRQAMLWLRRRDHREAVFVISPEGPPSPAERRPFVSSGNSELKRFHAGLRRSHKEQEGCQAAFPRASPPAFSSSSRSSGARPRALARLSR